MFFLKRIQLIEAKISVLEAKNHELELKLKDIHKEHSNCLTASGFAKLWGETANRKADKILLKLGLSNKFCDLDN